VRFSAIAVTARSGWSAAGALLGVAILLAGNPAHAALGAGEASIESDRVQSGARLTRVPHAAFSVHELSTGTGGVVREYVSPAGVVFAVSWHSFAMPNLKQILGAQYPTLLGSSKRQAGGRGHLAVTAGPLVFESNGRMRAFHGRAYLSTAIPAGVSTDDIQ